MKSIRRVTPKRFCKSFKAERNGPVQQALPHSMNVAHKLEAGLAGVRLSVLQELSRLAGRLRIDLYLVGGTVRDVLAGHAPSDIDVMAARTPERIVEALLEQGDSGVRKTSEFGTWSMNVRRVELDISTARRETYKHPGALPTVFQGTIYDDLARRDFSINAMAISLVGDSWGALLDPHGGARDMERGSLRVLHERSFEDDATRILRAIRYGCRLDFQLEARTAKLLETALPCLSAISPDRARREIERIFREPLAAMMIEMAGRLGVLAAIHPALRADSSTLQAIEAEAGNDARKAGLFLGSIVQGSTRADVEPVVKRLNLNADWAKIVRDVAEIRGGGLLAEFEDPSIRGSRVYGLLRDFHPNAVESCAMAIRSPETVKWLRRFLDELRHARPLLNGDDLMDLGVREGPAVGLMLAKLLDARLDGLVQSAEDERAMARRELES